MQNIIKDEIPDVYVHRIMIGPNIVIDTVSGFFRDTNRQVDIKIDKLCTFSLTLLTRCYTRSARCARLWLRTPSCRADTTLLGSPR